jgi:hypothetical protein
MPLIEIYRAKLALPNVNRFLVIRFQSQVPEQRSLFYNPGGSAPLGVIFASITEGSTCRRRVRISCRLATV